LPEFYYTGGKTPPVDRCGVHLTRPGQVC